MLGGLRAVLLALPLAGWVWVGLLMAPCLSFPVCTVGTMFACFARAVTVNDGEWHESPWREGSTEGQSANLTSTGCLGQLMCSMDGVGEAAVAAPRDSLGRGLPREWDLIFFGLRELMPPLRAMGLGRKEDSATPVGNPSWKQVVLMGKPRVLPAASGESRSPPSGTRS